MKDICNSFQRVEKKYMMNKTQYEAFLKAAKEKLCLDEYGLHTISNIYYDTEHYELIRHSIEKPKYKEKFRIRGYGQVTKDSRVFLEIKKKFDGIVYKRRTSILLTEAWEYLEHGVMPKDSNQIMREIDYFFQFYKPQPKLYLAYDRMAYAGIEETELRITIDQNIRSRRECLKLDNDTAGTNEESVQYLMEIKVPAAYPIWLARLLSELELYPISYSKYGEIYKESIMEGEKKCLQVYLAV